MLLSKNLLVRCDRVVKTLRPGKKKLSTWPAHLEIFPDQVFSDSDAFFAWAFVRRHPLWQTLLSFFWGVIFYTLSIDEIYFEYITLLPSVNEIVRMDAIRATIFGALYIILGKRVWFFPNILAEEATLGELFRFWPKKDEEERPKWTTRLFYAILSVLVILLLRHHAPDEAARARYQKRVSNIIDDVLEWSPRLSLSGMMEKQPTVPNVTETNPNFTDGSQPSVEPNSGEEPGIPTEHQVDDVPENIEGTTGHETPATTST
ncbi:hypothetical protein MLD38_025360 [Melastoma candidum]|uniref:Uncharacterized protein n=1 Tax=Melastoma candidum TaxID=119954 RepID=A0ACB9NY83_9MYRT|nr:hypothetical protein MLD38_025360 [Melastoma candidum]